MNILFLDDSVYRYDTFMKYTEGHRVCWAKTASEALDLLEEMNFDQIWLDHDLSEEHYSGVVDENTGRRVVQYIIAATERFSNAAIILHSLNPVGAETMYIDLMASALLGRNIYLLPFAWQNASFIHTLCGDT